MDGDVDKDGLRHSLDSMIALESWLEESLGLVATATKGYLETPPIVEELRSLVAGQRKALQAHLQEIGDTDVPPAPSGISAAFELPQRMPPGQAVATFRTLATAFGETALGYAVLHALAHRAYRVATADLADQHRRNYLRAVQAIHQAIGDVAVHELQEADHTCRCECPSCGAGICLCWHVHTEPDVTGPEVSTVGIVVREPRPQSNAERAGLRHGDVILAADGQEVRSYQDMQERMRAHEPGEDVRLRVRRGAAELEDLVLTR
jgi:hypothetical protein